MEYGNVGCLGHGVAEISPSSLRNMSGGMGLAAVMNAGSQPGVAHQVLGIFKAFDRTNGSQDCKSIEHRNPRQLNKQGHPILPDGFLTQTLFDKFDLLFGKLQGVQIGAKDALLDRGKRQGFPPGSLFRAERLCWPFSMYADQERTQAILGLGGHPHHFAL